MGLSVFSPIVAFHHLANDLKLPKDAKFWGPINRRFLDLSDQFYILHIPGHQSSEGIKDEDCIAIKLGLPRFKITPVPAGYVVQKL